MNYKLYISRWEITDFCSYSWGIRCSFIKKPFYCQFFSKKQMNKEIFWNSDQKSSWSVSFCGSSSSSWNLDTNFNSWNRFYEILFSLYYLIRLIWTTNTNSKYLQWFFCLFTFWVFLQGKRFELISQYTNRYQCNSL